MNCSGERKAALAVKENSRNDNIRSGKKPLLYDIRQVQKSWRQSSSFQQSTIVESSNGSAQSSIVQIPQRDKLLRQLHHAAHTTHTAHAAHIRHCWSRILWQVCNHCFSGDHQASNRSSELQG